MLLLKDSKDIITHGRVPIKEIQEESQMEGSSFKESKEILKLQASHVITVSILLLNMITTIKGSMHLLEQDLRMPLLGLVLGFFKILDSESWNMMHTIQNQHMCHIKTLILHNPCTSV